MKHHLKCSWKRAVQRVTAPPLGHLKASLHQRKLLQVALIFGCAILGVFAQPSDAGAQASQKLVTAFYYDNNDNLLQIEDLSGVSLNTRALSDMDHNRAPVINTPPAPALRCTAPTQPMLASAAYVVYYGFQPPVMTGTDLRAKPLKIEYVAGIAGRTLKCPPGPPSACTWPHWCTCGTAATCPAGCCI